MEILFQKLDKIVELLESQKLVQKTLLNFNEACLYLDISHSHLYKLTSARQIPHFCPQGKKLYFKREELDQWLQRNRQKTVQEIEAMVDNDIANQKAKYINHPKN
jgi:excisionase family DNA binding protein